MEWLQAVSPLPVLSYPVTGATFLMLLAAHISSLHLFSAIFHSPASPAPLPLPLPLPPLPLPPIHGSRNRTAPLVRLRRAVFAVVHASHGILYPIDSLYNVEPGA